MSFRGVVAAPSQAQLIGGAQRGGLVWVLGISDGKHLIKEVSFDDVPAREAAAVEEFVDRTAGTVGVTADFGSLARKM